MGALATTGKIIVLLSFFGIYLASIKVFEDLLFTERVLNLLIGVNGASMLGFLGLGLIQLEDYLNSRRRRNESATV